MSTTTITSTDSYASYVRSIAIGNDSMFLTHCDLWPMYLASFDDQDVRQYYNCNTCKSFIRRYGGLVYINADGTTESAVWNPEEAPSQIGDAVYRMKQAVESSVVRGVFLSSLATLGTPECGGHHHFHAKNMSPRKSRLCSDHEAMALKLEDYRTVSSALAGYSVDTLRTANALVSSDSLYRGEKVQGHAEWLLKLKEEWTSNRGCAAARNILWKAVASSPAGFCTPRSSVLGSLLDDIDSGVSVDAASKRFAAKMHPLQYRRPTAAPSVNAIHEAEKLVDKLGVAKSLSRRYAMFSDVETIWTPTNEMDSSSGVFGHLLASKKNDGVAVGGNITWVKFANDVLPKAKNIEVLIPAQKSDYTVFVTATHKDAPIIFQWDNPVSWYHWNGGCFPAQFGLNPGWVKCNGVCLYPHMWGGKSLNNFSSGVSFLINGAKETPHDGLSLFPEALKSEYNGIRKVVEMHSSKTRLVDIDAPHVIGKGVGATVRADIGVTVQYTIDRWE